MRKRIFLLNMLMMVTAMLILFLVITGFIRYRVQQFVENWEWVMNVDENAPGAEEVLQAAADRRDTGWSDIQRELDTYQYTLMVCRNQQLIYAGGELDENIKNWACEAQKFNTEGIHLVLTHTYVDASFFLGEDAYYLVALHLQDEAAMSMLYDRENSEFIYRMIVVGIVTIVLVVCIGWSFSKALVERVARPLDLLVDNLKMVGRGETAEPVTYQGDKEFELACEAFNTMQKEIQDHERERKEYEDRRTDMVTSISHDLRTPLTSIKGYIKAIMDGVADTPEKQAEFLQIAYDTTGEMDELLQKLFVFSKIETGKMPLYPVKIHMDEFLSQYIEKRKQTGSGEEMILLRKEAGSTGEGAYDVLQMQRVFDNLLENSLHYAGCSPVVVEISFEETGTEQVIRFRDNGCGVPEEKLSHIFERFYRCDEARGQEGNGVGLYIVKYIVEAHQGWVEAQNGDGFSIVMHFPKGGMQI